MADPLHRKGRNDRSAIVAAPMRDDSWEVEFEDLWYQGGDLMAATEAEHGTGIETVSGGEAWFDPLFEGWKPT
jgi:hypothetical protein